MPEKISIAMCTYNGERFLADQLASIAQQRRLPDELVVCDDQSTDRTVPILREFAASAPYPVRLVVNQRNLGYTANFAQAIRLCDSELIALSDQDDIWHPDRLERSVREFSNPETALIFSDADLIDARNRPLRGTLWRRLGFLGHRQQDLLRGRFVVLAKHRFVTGATVMFRAALRERFLPIPAGWVHDEWIVLVVAAFAELHPIQQPLIRYRVHGAQQVGFSNKLKIRAHGNHWVRLAESARELDQLCEFLSATRSQQRQEVLPAYQQHLQFLRFRSALPASQAKRLVPVLTHLSGYGAHASGLKSVLKDLVIPKRLS